MKRVDLYYCDGQYMKAKKIRRRYRKVGYDFDTAFRKSVYKESLGEKISKIVPWIELAYVLGIFASLMYMFS